MRSGRESLLLNERAGWRAASASATLEIAEGRLRLRRQPGSLRPIADAGGSFGGLTLPTGLAVDDRGRIYVLDAASAHVRRFDPCEGKFVTLPCVGGIGSGPRQFQSPHENAAQRERRQEIHHHAMVAAVGDDEIVRR